MKKYLKTLRRAAAACDALNNLVLETMMFAFLLMLVIVGSLWLWWYPVNYLTEGDQFHEQRIAKFMKCVGYKNVAHVSFVMPRSQFRDFETTCSAWVTNCDGKTYHPIEFTYRYERWSWLAGRFSIHPTRDSFANDHACVLDKYLEWSGTTREECKGMFSVEETERPEDLPD